MFQKTMSEHKIQPLQDLLSSDPDHIYSDDELDAIEAVDATMALRLARVQHFARQSTKIEFVDVPIDERLVHNVLVEVKKILAMDGGDIEFVDVVEHTVRVRMKGACVGCPNAVLDLKNVVEKMIREKVPGVLDVVNVF